jgi:hypothetical protein
MSENPLGHQKPQFPPIVVKVGSESSLSAGEFLAMYTTGTQFSLRAHESPGFLEVSWNAGLNKKPIHAHEVQIASQVWMDAQIRKRVSRKN